MLLSISIGWKFYSNKPNTASPHFQAENKIISLGTLHQPQILCPCYWCSRQSIPTSINFNLYYVVTVHVTESIIIIQSWQTRDQYAFGWTQTGGNDGRGASDKVLARHLTFLTCWQGIQQQLFDSYSAHYTHTSSLLYLQQSKDLQPWKKFMQSDTSLRINAIEPQRCKLEAIKLSQSVMLKQQKNSKNTRICCICMASENRKKCFT